jgi:hypothetical protein
LVDVWVCHVGFQPGLERRVEIGFPNFIHARVQAKWVRPMKNNAHAALYYDDAGA